MAGRVVQAFAQFFDESGSPLENGWLQFLESGTTTTNKNTYNDNTLQIPNENPLQLDGGGRCPNVFGTGDYRVVLFRNDPEDEDSPGEQIQIFDPVTAQGATTSGGGGGSFGVWDAITTYVLGDIVTHSNKYYKSLLVSNQNLNPAVETYAWEEIEFIGVWNDSITYEIGNVVRTGYNLYLSLQNSNLNHDPTTSPAWWREVATGPIASVTKTDDYTILVTERAGFFILGAATIAAKTFELPIVDATNDRFTLTIYNASDYNLTIDPLGTSVIWLESTLIIEKGTLVELFYDNGLDAWLIAGGNVGPVLGNQTLGTATNPVTVLADIVTVSTIGGTGFSFTSGSVGTLSASQIQIGDDEYIYLGDGNDCAILYDSAGDDFEFRAPATADTVFFFGGSAYWAFLGAGAFIPGSANPNPDIGQSANRVNAFYGEYIDLPDNGEVRLGDSDDIKIYYDGSNGYFDCADALFIRVTTATNHMHFYTNGSEALEIEDDQKSYFKDDVNLLDDKKLTLGTDKDVSIWWDNTGAGSFRIGPGGADPIRFDTNGSTRWAIGSTGTLYPYITNTYDIGTSIARVKTIYSINALDTSDIRQKRNVADCDLGLDFLDILRPVSFRYIDIKNDRTRYGLIAQELKEVMAACKIPYSDFAALHYDKKEDIYSIDYNHFIPIIIKALQEVKATLREHGIF